MSVRRCPICKHAVSRGAEAFPFCSKRCKLIDLANWLGDHYAIPDIPGLDESDGRVARDDGSDEWSSP